MTTNAGNAATATIVFTDLVGSTALRTALGEERADELRRVHDALLTEKITTNGGRVVKGGGDGLLAAFDSASAALTACVHIQQGVEAHNRRIDRLAELSVRIGVSAGDVSWEHGDCFGTPVVEAARLEAAAGGGQILCSDLVRLLARGRGGHQLVSVGELNLKGLAEPVPAHEVLWQATTADELPLPPSLALSAAAAFLGRHHEVAQAARVIDDTERPACGVVWLLGEPGIGKTALASQLAGARHRAGWNVLFGRCDESLQAPYQPLAQALRDRVQQSDPVLAALDLPTRMELALLCPELSATTPVGMVGGVGGGNQPMDPGDSPSGLTNPNPNPPGTSIGGGQDRLFLAVCTWLRAAAMAAPTLLVLDDAHWATDTTVLLVNFVLREVSSGRLCVLGTARDTEIPDLLRSIIDETTARPGALSMRLGGLSSGDVTALVGSAAGEGAGLAIHAQTAGNPFFVRALLAGGGSRSDDVDAAVRRRVTRLDQRTQDLLQMAALDGLEFDLNLVAHALGASGADALRWVDQAVTAALVEELGPNRFRFSHALVRDNLITQLGPTRRTMLHGMLAEAYQEVAPHSVNRLAWHWAEAAMDPAGRHVAVTHLLSAGRAATTAHDHDEAVRAYRRARELSDAEPVATRAEVALALGSELSAAGSHSEETVTALREAIALGGDCEASIRAMVYLYLLYVSGGPSPAPQDLAVVEAWSTEDPLRRIQLDAIAVAYRYYIGGPGALDLPMFERTVAEAQRLGDPMAIGLAESVRSTLLPFQLAEDRIASAQAAMAHMGRTGDPLLETTVIGRTVAYLMTAGHLDQAAAEAGRILAEGNRVRNPFLLHHALSASATEALLRGEFSRSEALADEALAAAQDMEGLDASGMHGLQMFSIRREQGRLAEVAPLLRVMERLNPDRAGMWRPGLAATYAELGMASEARAELDRHVVDGVVRLAEDDLLPVTASYLADAAVAVGDRDRAEALYRLMVPWQRVNVALLHFACYGPTARYLGMLAYTMGQPELADTHLRAALTSCQGAGMVTYEVPTRYWLGRVALLEGRRADAAQHFDHATALAAQLGMAGWTDRCRAALATDGTDRGDAPG
ncbi:MAG: ATP-binding protein [Acidimicrobiales bacterium]